MLGIRRYGAIAVDLFQGDAAYFVADVQTAEARDLASLAATVRHVAIVGTKDIADLSLLKATLMAGGVPQSLRRVTYVLASLDLYYAFQDELFRVFPEADRV